MQQKIGVSRKGIDEPRAASPKQVQIDEPSGKGPVSLRV
jgi:hypothetical protein